MVTFVLIMMLLSRLQSLIGQVLSRFGVPGLVLLVAGIVVIAAATAGLKRLFTTARGIAALTVIGSGFIWLASPKNGPAAEIVGRDKAIAAGKAGDVSPAIGVEAGSAVQPEARRVAPARASIRYECGYCVRWYKATPHTPPTRPLPGGHNPPQHRPVGPGIHREKPPVRPSIAALRFWA